MQRDYLFKPSVQGIVSAEAARCGLDVDDLFRRYAPRRPPPPAVLAARDAAMVKALAAGHTKSVIARVFGMDRHAIYQAIRRQMLEAQHVTA